MSETEAKKSAQPVKTRHLKNALLAALEKNMGVVTAACKAVKCNRSTFYDHYRKDKKFRAQVDAIAEVALDTAEQQLFKKIKKGDTIAILFYLKTKGKGRGYVERQEVDFGKTEFIVSRK